MMSFDYGALERQMQNLLILLADSLAEPEIKEVKHFLSVGEYGVAFETLCSILQERRVDLRPDAYALLKQLGSRMQLDSNSWELPADQVLDAATKAESEDDRILKRFYGFRDGVIRTIALHYEEAGTRNIEIHVATRDSETAGNEGWVSVRISILNVSEFGVRESSRMPIQVLSHGIHVLRVDNQVGVEFGGAIDCPESFESLRSSDGYAVGQHLEFQIGPY